MAILGSVVGDILGAQYEFHRPKDLDWKNVPLINSHRAGFTDDSVMGLAIKKAIVNNLDLVETMVSLGRKYPDCGYGGRFADWILGNNHKPYNSYGNGSAMRVSFVGEFYEDYEQMQQMAAETAKVSHNHQEGIKGAVVTATCIWLAKHGKDKKEIYDYVLEQYPSEKYNYSIDKDLNYLRKNYKWSLACADSVPVAMRCFYESVDYESFIRNVFSLDCDSDTIAAIAGGVAEEFYHGFGDIDANMIAKIYLTKELYDILIK